MNGPTIKRGKSFQSYSTPDDFMEAFSRRFGPPDWDLAADESNSKAGKCFLSKEQDSLKCKWGSFGSGNLWLNPPFSDINPWAFKCSAESALGAKIFMLVPASVGSEWFRRHVEPYAYVLALNPRLTFTGCATPYPKDCALCCYLHGFKGFSTWRWR